MDAESMQALGYSLDTLAALFYNEPDNQARAVELMQRELEALVHLRLQAYRQDAQQARFELEQERAKHVNEINDLVVFAQKVLTRHRDGEIGDVDGGFLQDAAVECGLLVEAVRTEACGDRCACAESGEPPYRCYFRSDRLERMAKNVTAPVKRTAPENREQRAVHLLRQIFYARCGLGTKFCDELAAWSLQDLEPEICDVINQPF